MSNFADENPATDDNFIQGATLPYTIAGCLTLPMCLFVIYTFTKYKQLRKHPAGLLLGRTFADLGFVLSVVVLSIITDWMENEIDTTDEVSQLTNTCVRWGVLTIFFLDTSQFYFIGMCYDLYVALKYPLRSQSYTAKQIHCYSWLIGLLMAVISYIWNNVSHDLSYSSANEVCFFAKSSLSWHSFPIFIFGVPYIIGVLSGITSLIFVTIRLKNGLGDVFSHAKRIVKEHIFFVSLYVFLGVIWWTLLLTPFIETQLIPFIIIIVVGTPGVDALSWFFQKFTTPFYNNKLKSKRQERAELLSLLRTRSISTLNAKQSDYISMATLQEADKLANKREDSISQALRMELIRSICGGITDAVSSAYKQSQLFDEPHSVTPLHFASDQAIHIMIGSDADRDCIVNQSIQRFNVISCKNKGKYNKYEFIDYSPHVFKYLRRQIYGVNDYEYIESITLSHNADINNVSAKFSEGSSGSFFFQTQDNQYMVKTISSSEMKTFLKMMPGYFEHVRKYKHSFINRYFGAYSIKMYGTKIFFTVMKNIFTANLEPHEKYDIKGSWRNRHTNYHIEEGRLMKDEDLHKNILLSHQQSKQVWDQLNIDTRFLTNLQVMDYSLLLGIYYIGVAADDVNNNDNNGRIRNWSFAHGFLYQQELEREQYSPPPTQKDVHNKQHMRVQIDEYDREMARGLQLQRLQEEDESKKRPFIEMKQMRAIHFGSLSNPNNDRHSMSYLQLDPSFRSRKKTNSQSNFNEPSVAIPSPLIEAAVSMAPTVEVGGDKNGAAYIQHLASPGVHTDELVSSYNTTQQRMSFGVQAPSVLIPSEDIENKTLRDIQSVAADDEESIKLLKHEQSFLRRRAFTSSSGLKKVSKTKNTFQARTIEGPGFYCLGIIDILQEWNWNKKLERFFKIYLRCQDSYGISCIEPSLYRKRFLAKMLQIGIGRKTAHV